MPEFGSDWDCNQRDRSTGPELSKCAGNSGTVEVTLLVLALDCVVVDDTPVGGRNCVEEQGTSSLVDCSEAENRFWRMEGRIAESPGISPNSV
ncbi:hypothetical protein T265_03890 [Opisthorchis viverrini]|uniref:Uncharacterized protein n=1 Tax=Opisthorchis viverrini TaxID=6198 RepID=A0A074ZQV0_OPIVI|nr:hypothetical protein T265_03890 [Opisthorchis viverrini]KER29516.1 hypothetical protein T265_03890 [Opisthorchis viverrini]